MLTFFLLCWLPATLICVDPFYAFALFVAWPLTLSYIAFHILGLVSIYYRKGICAVIALAALLAGFLSVGWIGHTLPAEVLLFLPATSYLVRMTWSLTARRGAVDGKPVG